jgi:magnesium-transporting ATPase (P-type)
LKKKHDNFESEESRAALESGLCLVATFGFADEMRPGVKEVVNKLYNTDCFVRVLSGDHKDCVLKALNDLGLEPNEELVISGEELKQRMENMFVEKYENDNTVLYFADQQKKIEFTNMAADIQAVYRVSPKEKF